MLKNKWIVTVLLVLLFAGSVLLFRFLKPNPEELLKKRVVERSRGGPAAKIWITEYFDYQCPPCANAYRLLDNEIQKDPHKIYLQVRHYPLPSHQNAMKAAIHAECAARQKGKFWEFHERLFSKQTEWATDPYAELKFLKYGQEAGLDLAAWDACTKDPEVEKFIREEKAKGEALGVKITPTFFVNGKIAVGNSGLTEELKKLENKDSAFS